MIRKGVPMLIAVGAAVAAASVGGAAPTGVVCGSMKVSHTTIHYETLGNGWIVKLAADHVAPSNHNVPLKNGPRGYHCVATPRTQKFAVSGACFKGTIRFPRSGFGWINF